MVQLAKTVRGISHPIMPFLSPRPEAFVLLVAQLSSCTARSLLGRCDDGHPARFPMRPLRIPLLGWPWLAGGSLTFSSAQLGWRGQVRCARKNAKNLEERWHTIHHAPLRAPYMAPLPLAVLSSKFFFRAFQCCCSCSSNPDAPTAKGTGRTPFPSGTEPCWVSRGGRTENAGRGTERIGWV